MLVVLEGKHVYIFLGFVGKGDGVSVDFFIASSTIPQ